MALGAWLLPQQRAASPLPTRHPLETVAEKLFCNKFCPQLSQIFSQLLLTVFLGGHPPPFAADSVVTSVCWFAGQGRIPREQTFLRLKTCKIWFLPLQLLLVVPLATSNMVPLPRPGVEK